MHSAIHCLPRLPGLPGNERSGLADYWQRCGTALLLWGFLLSTPGLAQLPLEVDSNPATPASLEHRRLHVGASQAYGLPELRLATLTTHIPMTLGTLEIGAASFGFSEYRESRFGLGLARALRFNGGFRIGVGMRIQVFHLRIATYGAASTLGLDIGWHLPVTEQLSVHAWTSNLNRPHWTPDDPLPRALAVGVLYGITDQARLRLDVEKSLQFPVSIRGELEVAPVASLLMRSGFGTAPTRFHAGTGVRLHRLLVDVQAERHTWLGWTPTLGLELAW